ncbi:hypothetical protein [Campylobacter sp. RM12651]|uniref:hypothetical protein n=1 Tax=Campylobacter sp. RM12651 TaxID=1660079 RepID=UPI001EFB8822|nr:hypothetical protein [Campylobacter sp. RM12651]ULO04533.1 putative membrane protein [Campylobacter sp. RM12651]
MFDLFIKYLQDMKADEWAGSMQVVFAAGFGAIPTIILTIIIMACIINTNNIKIQAISLFGFSAIAVLNILSFAELMHKGYVYDDLIHFFRYFSAMGLFAGLTMLNIARIIEIKKKR